MFGRPARGPCPGESSWGLNLGSDSGNRNGSDSLYILLAMTGFGNHM